MHDQLSDGRSYRLFNVINGYRHVGLAIEAGFSLPSIRVILVLNQLVEWREKPAVIRCYNGPGLSVMSLQRELNHTIYASNISSQASLSRTRIWSERTALSDIAG